MFITFGEQGDADDAIVFPISSSIVRGLPLGLLRVAPGNWPYRLPTAVGLRRGLSTDEKGMTQADPFDAPEHAHAIECVRKHFVKGLERYGADMRWRDRYRAFLREADPVHATLLVGMQDDALAATFVTYAALFQTIATQRRFWLEAAIADIVVEQRRRAGRLDDQVYSFRMLANGWLQNNVTVAEMGERGREDLPIRGSWKVGIVASALREIDPVVGREERAAAVRLPGADLIEESLAMDRIDLAAVVAAVGSKPVEVVNLNCNLLVIEPDRLDRITHAWGLRLINPKTLASPAQRKQERVNLLRLQAFLVQEKILRDPDQICVAVAEIVPRLAGGGRLGHYDYFSEKTYWQYRRFWDFVGVPFDVVRSGIAHAAEELSDILRDGWRGLLPDQQEE